MSQDIHSVGQELDSVKVLIGKARSFHKTHFKKLWPLFLFGSLGEIGISVSSGSDFSELGIPTWGFILSATIFLILIIFFFVSKIALYKSISDIFKGEVKSIKRWYSDAANIFWGFVLVSILVTLSQYGATLLLIVPGIILWGYLNFSQFEYVSRGKTGVKSLLGSWELVKNNWWKVFWRMLFISIRIFFVYFVVFAAIIIAASILGILATKFIGGVVGTAIMIGLIAVAVGAVILINLLVAVPLITISFFELYRNLQAVYKPENNSGSLAHRRKYKIVWCIVLGVFSMVLGFVFADRISKKFEKVFTSWEQKLAPSTIIVPVDGAFVYESPISGFTLDYPVTWSYTEEVAQVDRGYIPSVTFTPKQRFPGSVEDIGRRQPSLSVQLSSPASDVENVDELAGIFVDAIRNDQNLGAKNIQSTSTWVAEYPAVSIEYDFVDSVDPQLDAQNSVYNYRQQNILMIKGSVVYRFTYTNLLENYETDRSVIGNMISTFYPHYSQKTKDGLVEYANPAYGFSLKYPAEWLQIFAQPDDGTILSLVNERFVDGFLAPDKQVFVQVMNSSDSVEKLRDGIIDDIKKIDANVQIKSNIKISLSGHAGYEVAYDFIQASTTARKVVQVATSNGRAYYIIYTDVDPTDSIVSKIQESFIISNNPASSGLGMTLRDNRQFGYSMEAPSDWEILGQDEYSMDTIAGAYKIPTGSDTEFIGSLSISVSDDAYLNRGYSVEKYRDESIAAWKKTDGSDRFGFEIVAVGTSTINTLPASYFVATYKDSSDRLLKIKQVFIEDILGRFRFLTYIASADTFARDLPMVERVMQSFKTR